MFKINIYANCLINKLIMLMKTNNVINYKIILHVVSIVNKKNATYNNKYNRLRILINTVIRYNIYYYYHIYIVCIV